MNGPEVSYVEVSYIFKEIRFRAKCLLELSYHLFLENVIFVQTTQLKHH